MKGTRRGTGLGLAIALAVTLVTGCSGDGNGGDGGDGGDGSANLDLGGRTFVSQEVFGRPLVTGTQVTLSFEDDRISAEAGCNTMNAPATWTDGTLSVEGPMAMTRMACERGLQAQDEWLAEFLTSGPQVSIDGDTLILGNDRRGIVLTEGG